MLRKRLNLSQRAQRARLKQEFQPPPASSICAGNEDQPVGFSISSAAANDRVCSWRFLQRLYNILWSSTLFITICKFLFGRIPVAPIKRGPGPPHIFLFSAQLQNRSSDVFEKVS